MVVKAEKPVNCSVVGDAMVGKSAMIKAFLDHKEPESSYVATTIETHEGCLDVDGHKHSLNVLDNSGQHDYENIRLHSYKDSDVLVLCYSAVDPESFESISDFWVPELDNCHRHRKPIILVATQSDLRTDNTDIVTTEEGEMLAKEIGADCFLECSAVDMDSVTNVFEHVVSAGLRHKKKRHGLVHRIFGK